MTRNAKHIQTANVPNPRGDRLTPVPMTDKAIMPQIEQGTACKLHAKEIRASVDLACVSQVFAGLRSVSILGGNAAQAQAEKFSYWAAEPKEIFEFRAGQKDPFARLQKVFGKYRLADDRRDALPSGIFPGGWVGYFSYELGQYIERLPSTAEEDIGMPLIRLCFYDRLIAYDHAEGVFRLIALELPGESGPAEEKLAGLERLLDEAAKTQIRRPEAADLDDIDWGRFRCNMDRDYYLAMLQKIKRYIYDGDVYQINFSQRFECDYNAAPVDLFHWQNEYNPSGYAAYIDGGDFHIVSASPEMFATITDRFISTKPIKGTRRRICPAGPNGAQAERTNEKNFHDLLGSEKEKAELNMIIDLERNDLARICEPGTRHVIQPRTIEAYPTVFHAVATIGGRLRSEITFCDILRAIFPGGSITGAPKIRSMEIIDETEPTARGVYTGSIGYIGADGNVCLNIAIRTIIIAGQKAYAQTGGGIVADSDPQDEWAETITKARALLAGINSVQERSRCAK